MKKYLQFLLVLIFVAVGGDNLQAQDVNLSMGVSEDGTNIFAILESVTACQGDGISQASFTIRWPQGETNLRPEQALTMKPGTLSCQSESVFPAQFQSDTADYVLCTLEPPGGANIALDFSTGVDTLFMVPVDGIGEWSFEDLDGNELIPGNNATFPYVNIQNSPCSTAADDNQNSIRVESNALAYTTQAINNDGLLPVELTNFDSEIDGREITLLWETSSESENAGFAIEYAAIDGEYSELAFVDGNGTTSEVSNYQFVLGDFEFGVFKFRLKQVDFDGSYSYSPELDLTVDLPSDMVLDPAYPNPFNPVTNIRFAVKERQDVSLHLFDLQGRLVRNLFEGQMEGGVMKSFRLDALDLTSGTYIVQLRGDELKKSLSQTILLIK